MNNRNTVDAVLYNAIIICIIGMLILIFYYSSHRSFNFDEFQVLYASASLDRGKALYADNVGTHFPLMNIIFAILLKLYGFEATALISARIIIFAILCANTYFVYKIGKTLKDPETGALAALLTLSSLVFINKGIEIRHDVFNMFFNTAGVYYLIRFLQLNETKHAIISALCLGCALASTQKAGIWIFGIMAGFLLCAWRAYGKICKQILIIYPIFMIVPLFLCLSALVLFYNETTQAIFQVTIADRIGYITPGIQSAYAFPYRKTEILFPLLYENGFLYGLSVIAMILYIIRGFRFEPLKLILVLWTVTGLMFYLLMKRPFYQSLLPSIPPLALLPALFLSEFKEMLLKRVGSYVKGVTAFALILVIVLSWPIYLSASKIGSMSKMSAQMDNVSFCVSHLKPEDKVLSFTQQQIFFDSVFSGMSDNECGRTIFEMDEECFQKHMIKDQCKVVIYDHRTRLLPKAIRRKIADNYRSIGSGNILVPGFSIGPNQEAEKRVWIHGLYYVSHANVMIDDKRPNESGIVNIENRSYFIRNANCYPVIFIYLFNPLDKAIRSAADKPFEVLGNV